MPLLPFSIKLGGIQALAPQFFSQPMGFSPPIGIFV
jgi:hypothetical protein